MAEPAESLKHLPYAMITQGLCATEFYLHQDIQCGISEDTRAYTSFDVIPGQEI